QEQDGYGGCRKSGASAGLQARSACDGGRVAACTQGRTANDGGTVGQQGAAQAVGLTVGNQVRALADGKSRAGGVKCLDQHQYKNDVHDTDVQCTHDGELQESRCQAGWCRKHALELAVAGNHRQNGNGYDADQDGAAYLERIQGSDEEEAQYGEHCGRSG